MVEFAVVAVPGGLFLIDDLLAGVGLQNVLGLPGVETFGALEVLLGLHPI